MHSVAALRRRALVEERDQALRAASTWERKLSAAMRAQRKSHAALLQLREETRREAKAAAETARASRPTGV